MKFLGIIPARYSSTRLEGKPLKMIEGHTMIEWVYKRAKKSNLDALIVATDDERIYNEVINFGGQAIMTNKNHTNGTSRIAEVCEKMTEYNIIINIQGDEPLIEYEMINSLIETFKENKDLKMATLKHKLLDKEEKSNLDLSNAIQEVEQLEIIEKLQPVRAEFRNLSLQLDKYQKELEETENKLLKKWYYEIYGTPDKEILLKTYNSQ